MGYSQTEFLAREAVFIPYKLQQKNSALKHSIDVGMLPLLQPMALIVDLKSIEITGESHG
jgi:hypothetical protein